MGSLGKIFAAFWAPRDPEGMPIGTILSGFRGAGGIRQLWFRVRGSIFLRVGGGPERLLCSTFSTLFFDMLLGFVCDVFCWFSVQMWIPWRLLWTVLRHFGHTCLEVNFWVVLGSIVGGAGGRGGACQVCRICRIWFVVLSRLATPAGAANLRASPLQPAPCQQAAVQQQTLRTHECWLAVCLKYDFHLQKYNFQDIEGLFWDSFGDLRIHSETSWDPLQLSKRCSPLHETIIV